MNGYYVVRLTPASPEQRVGRNDFTSVEAEAKRDRLNEDLAHHGVKYSEVRYAMRLADERAVALGAAA